MLDRQCQAEIPTAGISIGVQLRSYKQSKGSWVTRRLDHLDRFYRLLEYLEARCGGKRKLADCSGRMSWPERGVYFFFDPGEFRADGITSRVVRVGTHGLRPSKSTLWGRLSQHRGSSGGEMPGGGNHRSSIFRFHVGTALLATTAWPESILRTWSIKKSTLAVRQAEYPLEKAVSAYIGELSFLWLEVGDPPSAQSDRGVVERGAIALLSNLDRSALDPPSPAWLGRSADRSFIRDSGLWNVNHVAESPDPDFLRTLERYVVHS